MYDSPDLIDDYDEDDEPVYAPDPDPVSEAVGAHGYLHLYMLEECQETFPNSPIARFPETFDRFYFDADGGQLLIDLLADGTPEQLGHERDRKRVAFKAVWCAEHGRRYLPLPESEATVPGIRALLAGAASEPAASVPSVKPARQRGKVQRPKAAA